MARTARRAIGYVRVSDEGRRGDALLSPEIQRQAIADHCARRGYRLLETLEDIDATGRLWRRRQIEHAVAEIEAGRADVIVVWKWSRVSRNRRDWAIAVDRVETAGGRLESATENVDTSTSTGRFTRGMLAELAAFESERIGDTWRETHDQRRAQGLPHSAPRRLGYTYSRADGYQPDPETAPIVVDLYRRYTTGEGVGELAKLLATLGVPVPKSGAPRWTRYGVDYFMRSGFAAGLLQTHDPACGCGKPSSCKRRIRRPGAHPAIVSAELWAAFEAEQARRAETHTRARRAAPARLTGVVFCAGCGRPMQLQASNSRPRSAYVCRTNRLSVLECEAPAWCRRDTAEQAVRDWLPTIADQVEQAAAGLPSPAVNKQQRARLARRVSDADAALARLAVDNARVPLPAGAYDAAVVELTGDRDRAAAELAALPTVEAFAARVELSGALLRAWDELDDDPDVNLLVRKLLRVNVSRGGGPVVVGLWE